VTVDEEGDVMSARAISGHPLLRDSAIEAAQRWKFKPTLVSGVAVKVIGEISFNFSLEVTSKQIDALLKEVERNPTSGEAHYKLGSAYYDANMFYEAIKELQEAIRLKPEFAEAYCKLGLSYRVFNPEEAAISFKEAIRFDPRYVEAIVGLGAVNIRLGRYDEAIGSFERAIELEPKSAGSFFSLGFAYSKTGRNEEAISNIQKGLKIYPESPQAHYSLGKLYVATGNKQAALDEYTILKKLDAQLAETLLKEIGK
jgi:tetratricopeptide (TPR) repeat protein